MGDTCSVKLYPLYCFHLSPSMQAWCWFKICEIHALKQYTDFEAEKFYFYRNLPIQWVRIVGIVCAIDDFAGRRLYTIDDSSGACIECVVKLSTTGETASDAKEANGNRDVHLGTIVDVKGSLNSFRDERQIDVDKMTPVRCTADEIELWQRRDTQQREILDKPWILPEKQIRRCRREAEGTKAQAEREKQRLKEIATISNKPKRPAKTREPQNITDASAKKENEAAATRLIRDNIRTSIASGQYKALGL